MAGTGHAPSAKPVAADDARDVAATSRWWGRQWIAFLAGGLVVALSRLVSDSAWWAVALAVTAVALALDLLRRRSVALRRDHPPRAGDDASRPLPEVRPTTR
jgi:hypothetical protein